MNPGMQPTVYVVDDDFGVRTSIRMLLKSAGIAAVPLASAREFLEGFDADQPGCLVLDIRMPEMGGLELQQELNRRGALIPVIFITGHGDVPMAVEAMRQGAFDFLQKPFRDQDLIDRIHKALERDRESRLAMHNHVRIVGRMATLTSREREVLELLSVGKQNKVMAAELGISQRTVEIHRAHLMEKLGARSVAQLVRMMMAVAER